MAILEKHTLSRQSRCVQERAVGKQTGHVSMDLADVTQWCGNSGTPSEHTQCSDVIEVSLNHSFLHHR